MAHAEPGDRITFVGHSTVLIELAGVRLLTDPVLRSRLLHITRAAPAPAAEVRRAIDAVLISHLHPDHLDFPSLRMVGRDVRVIAPARSARMLRRRGVRNVTEIAPGDATEVGAVEVHAVRAAHDGRRYPIGRPVKALCLDLRGGDRRVFFAGDTDLFGELAELAGGLDVALLPIAGWGPRVGGGGHLDAHSAAEAAAILQPRIAVPIHWGSLLRIGLRRTRPELLSDPPREFEARLAELAPGVEAGILAPGESLTLARPSA
jgi:L-ascorbate metabolism protein UlaG (beta-lactamase superfamily)